MAKLKIIGLPTGEPTPFDGQYVVEYDPTREGVDPEGDPMLCHLVCTPDPAQALDLPADEALALWKRSHGIRFDGMPNRPLSAFTVEVS